MEYVYSALILNETGEEINEDNVTAILEAAGADVEQSRVKALVAALEDVNIEEAIDTAAAAPATGGAADAGAGAAAAAAGDDDEDEGDEAVDEAEEEEAAEEEDDDDEASGEGLGELFG